MPARPGGSIPAWEKLGAGEGAIRDLVDQAGEEGLPPGEVPDAQLTDEEQVRHAIPVFCRGVGRRSA